MSALLDPQSNDAAHALGGIILAGGKSERIGKDKAELKDKEGQTLLSLVASTLAKQVAPIVVVGNVDPAKHQASESWIVVQDENPNQGPLEGLRVGLQAMEPLADAAVVVCCDSPRLTDSFLAKLIECWHQDGKSATGLALASETRIYGLTAIYRTETHALIARYMHAKNLRVKDFVRSHAIELVSVDAFRAVDPDLKSLTNVNTLEDYQRFLDYS